MNLGAIRQISFSHCLLTLSREHQKDDRTTDQKRPRGMESGGRVHADT